MKINETVAGNWHRCHQFKVLNGLDRMKLTVTCQGACWSVVTIGVVGPCMDVIKRL
ncbi:hypothetical protein [Carboxylicivirga sp. RSCT41]|uniref:hypothetical protein n=1 Tax=Carboxylicivirga agarovorans TaxID=3417570 RepID=UPI003D34E5F0